MKKKKMLKEFRDLIGKYKKLYDNCPTVAKGPVAYMIKSLRQYYDKLESDEVEWINTDLDDMTLKQRLSTIDQWFDTFGLCLSSLGDDTSSLICVSPNHVLQEYTYIYIKLSGWIVEVKKSLGSPFNGEYLREQPHCLFVVKVKSFAPHSSIKEESWVTNIIICKPLGTVLRANFGTENLESKSPLIREIGKLARLLNVNLYPALNIVVDRFVSDGIAELGLFTQPFDYVPMRNLNAWKKAGKPEHSVYHVRIKNLQQGLSVAGDDALYLEEINNMPKSKSADDALTRSIGQSWTKSQMEDYEFSKYLPSTRLCRYINAVNRGDSVAAQKVIDEVQIIKSDIIYQYNYPEAHEVEEATTFTQQ